MNPTMIKNHEINAKNLPGMSFRNFASSRVPARIVSNEMAKRCILIHIKLDYSFTGFRLSRSDHGSVKLKSSRTFTNIRWKTLISDNQGEINLTLIISDTEIEHTN